MTLHGVFGAGRAIDTSLNPLRGREAKARIIDGARRAAYFKCRLACLAGRRSIQFATRALVALKYLRALRATDSKVRHASVVFNQAMDWLYH